MAQTKKAKTESRESQEDSRLFAFVVDELTEIRLDRHQSQETLAKRIGISQSAWGKIEAKIRKPSRISRYHIERVLRELRGE